MKICAIGRRQGEVGDALDLNATATGPVTIGMSSGVQPHSLVAAANYPGRVERRVGAGEVDLAGVEVGDAVA